jgi:hypothetical protein
MPVQTGVRFIPHRKPNPDPADCEVLQAIANTDWGRCSVIQGAALSS